MINSYLNYIKANLVLKFKKLDLLEILNLAKFLINFLYLANFLKILALLKLLNLAQFLIIILIFTVFLILLLIFAFIIICN